MLSDMSGGFEAATSFGSTFANLYMNERNNRENMRRQQQQQDYNLRLWQMNNAYNTPVEQRRRMEMAGFNPNLIAGQGSNFAGVSPVPAQGVNPIPSVAPSIDTRAIMEAGLLASQRKNVDSDTYKKDQEGDLLDKQNHVYFQQVMADIGLTKANTVLAGAKFNETWQNIKQITQNIENMQSQKKLLDKELENVAVNIELAKSKNASEKELRLIYVAQREGLLKDNAWKDDFWKNTIKNLETTNKYNIAKTYEAYKSAEEKVANIAYTEAKTTTENDIREKFVAKLQEEVENLKKQGKNIDADTQKKLVEKVSLELENELTERYGDARNISEIAKNGASAIGSLLP